MYKYEVGKIVPEFANHEEIVQFDLADDGAFMLVFFKNPKKKEIAQFSSGNSFEIRMTKIKNIIFLMSKIGNLNWIDAPYNPHLSLNFTQFTLPSNDMGLGLTLILIDAVTGRIESLRLLGLSERFTRDLLGEVMDESVNEFDHDEYLHNVSEIYRRYTTKDLVKLSGSYCKIS